VIIPGIFYGRRELNILLFGVKEAGKTALINYFKSEYFSKDFILPCELKEFGFEAQKIRFKTVDFNFFEIALNDTILNFIEKHKISTIIDAVICILDTREKIEDAKRVMKEINHMRFNHIAQNAPFAIVGNKQDCENAMSITDILLLCEQDTFRYTNRRAQLACIKRRGGITDLLSWIFESLRNVQ